MIQAYWIEWTLVKKGVIERPTYQDLQFMSEEQVKYWLIFEGETTG